MTRIGTLMILLAVAAGSALPAAAAEPDGASFIKEAIQGNLGEVKVGALAQQKGVTQGVKQFGATLEQDHAAANRQAVKVAQTLGVSPPKEPGTVQKELYQTLSGLSGRPFDTRFVEAMIADHQKDIESYEMQAQGNGPAAEYARHVLPDLRKHLEMAQRLQGGPGTEGVVPH